MTDTAPASEPIGAPRRIVAGNTRVLSLPAGGAVAIPATVLYISLVTTVPRDFAIPPPKDWMR